jgi:hypothetical protein
MWGSWFGMTAGGLLVLAGLIALAFGTSGAVFGVLIALGIVVAIAVGFGILRGSRQPTEERRPVTPTGSRNPRSGGAPAEGEGSGGASPPPAPHEPARTP